MKKQKLKTKIELVVTAAAAIAAAAVVNYAANKFFYRIDLTENKQYTVSDATKRVLRGLDDIVVVKAFFSKDLPPETHETVSTVRDLLSEYKNIAGGNLRLTWEDPAGNEEAAAAAQSLGVPAITLQTIKQDKAQAMNGYMGIGIMYADRSEAIPVVQNLANLEYDLTSAIMKVRRAAPPKVGILKSQSADFIPEQIRAQMNMAGETTDKRFAPLFENLKHEYEIVVVDVSEGSPIDTSISTLIILGGERWTDRALFEVDQYFMNGGNLLVLTGAVNISFRQGPQATPQETKLLELLEHYGVKVETNIIMDMSCGFVSMPRNVGPFTVNEPIAYPYFVRIVGGGFAQDNPVVSSQSELMLGWASSLTDVTDSAGQEAAMTILASSSPQSWEVRGQFDINPQSQASMYNIPPKEEMRPHTLAAHLTGNFKSYFDGLPVPPAREISPDEEDDPMSRINLAGDGSDRAVKASNAGGNIVIVGDANFISAQNAQRPNVIFLLNIVDWLSLENNLIAIRSRTLRDKTINANVLEEGSSKPGMIRLVNLLLMPLVVIAVGIFISLKRRERPLAAASSGTAAAAGSAEKENTDEK